MTKRKKDNQTQPVHLQLQKDLVKKLDSLAEAQKRTRVNMISVLLEEVLTQKEAVSA